MKYIFYLSNILLLAWCIVGCETIPENLEIQKPFTYSDKYYENLRSYKASDHPICFGWYAAYDTDASPSYGNHFMGLPDSIDIISLWKAIPSNDPAIVDVDENNRKYLPDGYKEMHEMRRLKGTKVVMAKIVRIAGTPFTKDDQGIHDYAMWLVNCVLDNDLDGLDMDYEPEGDWMQGDNFLKMVEIIGKYLGPLSQNPDKLLICDFYGETPPAATEPYVNYFIRQSYGANNAIHLQDHYNVLKSWCPPHKFVVTEQMGDHWRTGGKPFTEVDGNTLSSDGKPLYSLEGMARWNPIEGRKGGFGAFYFEYEYNLNPDYVAMRRAIQAQNPAIR